MSEGLYSHTTRAIGTILTAEIYNNDHQNHITNHNPSMMGGLSDSVGQMQSVANPGEVGTESLASSLAGELQRIRFQLQKIIGKAQWYEEPVRSLDDPFADVNGTFTSATGGDQTPATRVSNGVFFNLDWAGSLSGQTAEYRIGRTSIADAISWTLYKPNTADVAFNITTGESSTVGGDVIATEAEAVAAEANNKLMTPLRSKEQIDGRLASKSEAEEGEDDTQLMTPLRVKEAIEALAPPPPTEVGAVGTYALLAHISGGISIVQGTLIAGSSLRYSAVAAANLNSQQSNLFITGTASPPGTWRLMGRVVGNSSYNPSSLYLRIA